MVTDPCAKTISSINARSLQSFKLASPETLGPKQSSNWASSPHRAYRDCKKEWVCGAEPSLRTCELRRGRYLTRGVSDQQAQGGTQVYFVRLLGAWRTGEQGHKRRCETICRIWPGPADENIRQVNAAETEPRRPTPDARRPNKVVHLGGWNHVKEERRHTS